MQDEQSLANAPHEGAAPGAAPSVPPGDKHPPKETPSRKGCLRWTLGILALLVAAPCLCCCGGWFYWSRQAQQAVEVELARIHAAGEPVEIAELKSMASPSADEPDATALWRQAFDELNTPAFAAADAIPQLLSDGTGLRAPPAAWPDQEVAAQFLDDHAAVLKLLHQAAQQGTGEFDASFEQGVLVEFKYLSSVQWAFRLLRLKAFYDAHMGDSAGAASALRDTLSLARLLQRQPAIIPQLAGFACISSVWSSLQDLMPGNEWSEQDLLSTQAALRQLDPRRGLKDAMLGERVLAIQTFSHGEDMTLESPGEEPGQIKRHEDLAYALKNFRDLLAAIDMPWPAMLVAGKTLESQIKQNASGLAAVRYLVTTTIFPPIYVVLNAGARTEAFLATADTAIALELFRRKTGAFPQTLAELTPDWLPTVPLDPFDGKSLRYHPPANETDFAIVYSIGENAQDDGANPTEGAKGISLDLVFRVSTPPKSRTVPD